MNRITAVVWIVAASSIAVACKKTDPPRDSPPPAPAAVVAAPAPAEAAQPPRVTAERPKKGARCPTSIPGATASAHDTRDGVALTITAKDEAAAGEIRERAHALLASPMSGGGGGGDGTGGGDGSGGGGGGGAGGGMGKCPVVVRGTKLEASDVAGGTTVTMRPTSADGLAALRKRVRARLAGDDG